MYVCSTLTSDSRSKDMVVNKDNEPDYLSILSII